MNLEPPPFRHNNAYNIKGKVPDFEPSDGFQSFKLESDNHIVYFYLPKEKDIKDTLFSFTSIETFYIQIWVRQDNREFIKYSGLSALEYIVGDDDFKEFLIHYLFHFTEIQESRKHPTLKEDTRKIQKFFEKLTVKDIDDLKENREWYKPKLKTESIEYKNIERCIDKKVKDKKQFYSNINEIDKIFKEFQENIQKNSNKEKPSSTMMKIQNVKRQ